MANLIQDQHYVNFLRGTPEAWERLQEKNSDTLYFISEKNGTTGRLYLGNKLISSFDGDITLESIIGIMPENLKNGSLLAYNAENQKWENKNLSELLSPILGIMEGSTEEKSGTAGLVPVPSSEDANSFLKGDGTWGKYQMTEEDINYILSKVEYNIYWDNF